MDTFFQIKLRNIEQEIYIQTEISGNMSEEVESHILKRYSLIKKVGSGAYGHVWKVTDRSTNKILALKKIFDAFQHSTDAQRTFREIVILHEINHPNIIKLHNVIRAKNDQDLYLVFEYMEADLHNAIGQKILQDIHNRYIIYQITKALKFLHSAQLIHRDLKPSNILLNSDCLLRICDFGLSRSLVDDLKSQNSQENIMTEEVATRWYRAPEVLLGSNTYGKAADIWSLGCILGELLLGKPMFPGNSTLNQLERIIMFTNKPNFSDIQSLNSETAQTMIQSINFIKVKSLNEWFDQKVSRQAIDLLSKMLAFNPSNRPTAAEILKHPYLKDFRNIAEQVDSKFPIHPPISDNKKLSMKQYRQLIYDRIGKLYNNNDNVPRTYSNSSHKQVKRDSYHSYDRQKDSTQQIDNSCMKENHKGGYTYSSKQKRAKEQKSLVSNQNNNKIGDKKVDDIQEKSYKKSSIKQLLKYHRKSASKNDKNLHANSSYKYIKNPGNSYYSFLKENNLHKPYKYA